MTTYLHAVSPVLFVAAVVFVPVGCFLGWLLPQDPHEVWRKLRRFAGLAN